jgi:hypothetical protein
VLTVGCAAREGWQRTARRACEEAEAPRICVAGAPDRAAVVRVGGAELVPGECAASPRARGGRVRVEVEDGTTGARRGRRVRAPRGKTTRVAIADDGAPRVRDRVRCSGQVAADMSEETASR